MVTTIPGLFSDPFAAFGLLSPALGEENRDNANVILMRIVTVDPKIKQRYTISNLVIAMRNIEAFERVRICTPRHRSWPLSPSSSREGLARWSDLSIPITTGIPLLGGLQSLLVDTVATDAVFDARLQKYWTLCRFHKPFEKVEVEHDDWTTLEKASKNTSPGLDVGTFLLRLGNSWFQMH